MEVERVAHKLKINTRADAKEWRSHLEQTKKYAEGVKKSLPDVRSKLEKVSDEVSKAIEKIAKKETLLNKSFVNMTGDYRSHADNLKNITEEFNKANQNAQELEKQLYEINERLTHITKKMDDAGQNISNTQPLIKIKKAMNKVKADIKSIDIRIGVVSNTLLQCKLKERNSKEQIGKGGLDIEGDGYDLDVV